MAHDHSHAGSSTYYLDQLCTIGFCGALGVVQILLYQFDVLRLILDPKFHLPVLLSGIVLTALAVLRGASLWVAVGQSKAHHHHHEGEACGHDHDLVHTHPDCGHDHDHSHDHEHEHAH